MSKQRRDIYCDTCQRPVVMRRQPLDISAQVFVSVLTLGLWLPIWLLLWLSSPKICAECGQVLGTGRRRG